MYDDTTDSSLCGVTTRDPFLHFCPQCRDLMAQVLDGPRVTEVAPPQPPDWERALGWLDAQCGGREAVLALHDRPWDGPAPGAPAGLPPQQRELFAATAAALLTAGERLFTPEFTLACLRALVLVFAQRPGLTVDQRPGGLAHGVAWAVGRANGLLYPSGIVTDRTLRECFDSRQAGSSTGRKVQVAVRSLFSWSEPRADDWRWPVDRAPLEPLGSPALLVAGVRCRLIEVRERALHEAALAPAG
ncbi:hypothetical protein [Nocardioides sp.]|uniref:hypothetical protein n=1 Tax=Nocardioides sp. TaxID=35761 RepID=UPI002611452F|nr:hypothetical protein [Nocardioides sp.]